MTNKCSVFTHYLNMSDIGLKTPAFIIFIKMSNSTEYSERRLVHSISKWLLIVAMSTWMK